ncbi:hypothetical protein HY032_00010, partial [Candidatus Gottesmanbacteria bacterium]|nr:hypothetical protein [Candidatus Gottesmanbacteria bacterium]
DRLADAEAKALARGVEYRSSQLDAQRSLQGQAGSTLGDHRKSNEASGYVYGPYIRAATGGVIGVGPEQVLDLLANSATTFGVLVDYTQETTLTSRMLLEVGMYHKKTFGRTPTRDEFTQYFEKENLPELRRILSRVLTAAEVDTVLGPIEADYERRDSPSSYAEYLRLRSALTDPLGQRYTWLGSQDGIDKILDMYERGDLLVVLGDVRDGQVLGRIGQEASRRGVQFSLYYWSNLEDFVLASLPSMLQVRDNFLRLPHQRGTLILRSDNRVLPTLEFPASVGTHPEGRTFLPFHYNVQRFSDWESKARQSDAYALAGWMKEVDATGDRKGFSVIGVPPADDQQTVPRPSIPFPSRALYRLEKTARDIYEAITRYPDIFDEMADFMGGLTMKSPTLQDLKRSIHATFFYSTFYRIAPLFVPLGVMLAAFFIVPSLYMMIGAIAAFTMVFTMYTTMIHVPQMVLQDTYKESVIDDLEKSRGADPNLDRDIDQILTSGV